MVCCGLYIKGTELNAYVFTGLFAPEKFELHAGLWRSVGANLGSFGGSCRLYMLVGCRFCTGFATDGSGRAAGFESCGVGTRLCRAGAD